MKDQLLKYTQYNIWANTKICNFVSENLSEEQVDKEISSSFPSLRKTIYHIRDAETIWINRLTGKSITTLPIVHAPMTFEEFQKKILDGSKQLEQFVQSLNEENLTNAITYTNSAGQTFTSKISEIIHHCMNHSTFHRGQIITMLRQLGFTKLFSTDYIAWCRE